jgi:hypothetical protein
MGMGITRWQTQTYFVKYKMVTNIPSCALFYSLKSNFISNTINSRNLIVREMDLLEQVTLCIHEVSE